MRYAQLERNNRGLDEIVLILDQGEVRALVDAVGDAAKAHPRKRTYKKLAALLDDLPGYGPIGRAT